VPPSYYISKSFVPLGHWEVHLGIAPGELTSAFLDQRRATNWWPVSLGSYGHPPYERYVIVWRQLLQPSQPWKARFGVSLTSLMGKHQDWIATGYYPALITAAGAGTAIRYGAVYRKEAPVDGQAPTLLVPMPLDIQQLDDWCAWARAQQMALSWATTFAGTNTLPRYNAIFRRLSAPNRIGWNYGTYDDPTTANRYCEAYAKGWVRPQLISVSDTGHYLAIWHDDTIPMGTVEMTVPLHQHGAQMAIDELLIRQALEHQLYPVRLQARAVPGNVEFVVIFAETDRVKERVLTIRRLAPDVETSHGAKPDPGMSDLSHDVEPPPFDSGPGAEPQPPDQAAVATIVPFFPSLDALAPVEAGPGEMVAPKPAAASSQKVPYGPGPDWPGMPPIAQMDAYVVALMQHYGIRAGSLAITKNGKLLLSHAYTWAQPDYPKTTHTTAFRLGSVSKLLCYIAVMQLWDQGQLGSAGLDALMQAPDMLALKTLGNTDPAAGNAHWGQIRLTHLMRHLTGWLLKSNVPLGDPPTAIIDYIWGGGFAERDDIRAFASAYPNPPSLDWPLPLETLTKFFVTMSGALTHLPGSHPQYSNVDPVFLAQLVKYENPMLLELHEYLPLKVFGRIGVPEIRTYSLGFTEYDKGFTPVNQARFHAAVPWVVFSLVQPDLAPGMPVLVPSPYANNWCTQTAPGGYVASSVDMARVLAALERVDLFNQPDSPVLMSPAARTEMWSDPSDGFDVTRGGWFIERPPGALATATQPGLTLATRPSDPTERPDRATRPGFGEGPNRAAVGR